MIKFTELSLDQILQDNLQGLGHHTPTPIQAQSIPPLLEGRDLLGIAQTGTGKTAAFSLPLLERLKKRNFSLTPKKPRSLILAPTRELASQIQEQIHKYGDGLKLKSFVIFGGVGFTNQIQTLRKGVDILVATPGRLLDLIQKEECFLDMIEVFILDEADRMLDMGFIHDIKKIIKFLPPKRQTMLFSATMPDEINKIIAKILKDPVRIEVTPPSTTVEKIEQKIIFCQKNHKYQLLRQRLQKKDFSLTLVFARTKHGANSIVEYLQQHKIQSLAIHGNKSQTARETALAHFKSGKIKVLIATDIAARGIDIEDITHVINFDLPLDAESYVHRIGRTARAGKDGEAISFCDESQRDALSRIQKLIGFKLPTESFVGINEKIPKRTRPPHPSKSSKGTIDKNKSDNKKKFDAKKKAPKVGHKFRKGK